MSTFFNLCLPVTTKLKGCNSQGEVDEICYKCLDEIKQRFGQNTGVLSANNTPLEAQRRWTFAYHGCVIVV